MQPITQRSNSRLESDEAFLNLSDFSPLVSVVSPGVRRSFIDHLDGRVPGHRVHRPAREWDSAQPRELQARSRLIHLPHGALLVETVLCEALSRCC